LLEPTSQLHQEFPSVGTSGMVVVLDVLDRGNCRRPDNCRGRSTRCHVHGKGQSNWPATRLGPHGKRPATRPRTQLALGVKFNTEGCGNTDRNAAAHQAGGTNRARGERTHTLQWESTSVRDLAEEIAIGHLAWAIGSKLEFGPGAGLGRRQQNTRADAKKQNTAGKGS